MSWRKKYLYGDFKKKKNISKNIDFQSSVSLMVLGMQHGFLSLFAGYICLLIYSMFLVYFVLLLSTDRCYLAMYIYIFFYIDVVFSSVSGFLSTDTKFFVINFNYK